MSTPIFVTIGIDEAVRLVCQELAPFAVPNKLPHRDNFENLRRVGEIEIWFDMKNVGFARFHCVTWDNVDIDVGVDFGALTRQYLDEIRDGVQKQVNEHRKRRSPMVLDRPADAIIH